MLMIAWTTVASLADAERLAADSIEQGLAACVQVDGPITSHYRWAGKVEQTSEFRLMFKTLPARVAELETRILAIHPYDTPEWIVVPTQRVSEKYLSWARENTQSLPL